MMRDEPRVIRLARVHDPVVAEDGARLPIDRLWPSGAAKGTLVPNDWLVTIRSSPELRRRFHAAQSRPRLSTNAWGAAAAVR